ncbi:MAG: isoleucine--tRNA ligase [Fibrobacteria bacterium]|nr:isoleucine--tRNA ligase [Fibrobacteria bacterium]
MFRPIDKNKSFPQIEKDILAKWQADEAFTKSVEEKSTDNVFTFYDGPPFATGLPHYGHLLAGTIKDIVPRYWTMKGKRVERRFGWDCHGLPIESLIQDRLKLSGIQEINEYGIGNFNEACRSSVLEYTSEWEHTVDKMGRWVDFKNDYKTMDRDFMESVWWVFNECFKKGLIYQGYRIQPYSPALATPLSNFETNQGYKDRQDPSLTLIMPLKGEDTSLLVWTTTPWTLPSNLAVAMGTDITYVLVEQEGKKFWVAEQRMTTVFGEDAIVLERRIGKDFEGKQYEPLMTYAPELSPKQYTVILADFVSTEDGTGAVHIAPSFGEEDFQLGDKHGLGLFDPLDEQGCFTSLVSEWEGLGAKEADKSIIQWLKAKGRVFKQDTIVHSYPHCYRTDVPLLYRALKTWFLNLEKEITSPEGETKTLKQWMIACNEQINWIPEHIKHGRFGNWLKGARDWNLSRNRFWGTPIPIWMADDGEQICVGSVEELERLTGQDVKDLHKHLVDPLEIKTSDGKTFDPNGKVYRRTPEVLDCWFESGSMPYAQKHYPFENKEQFEKTFPADFIAEGLDQTRGWFYTLTVLGAALFQKPAFKNVIINGIILAENGQKMSKRLQNYPDPNKLIDITSADAIRLFMIDSAAVKAGDLKFSEAGVNEMVRSVLLPLWNALSLFVTYANADAEKGQLSWKPGENLISENELDQWILSDLEDLLKKIQQEMEAFRLYNVVPAVIQFIDDLTNWYIRRSRRRFWKSENDNDKNNAYATLYRVLVEFSKVLAPILPFLAEEIYQILVREVNPDAPVSVHLCDYPVPDSSFENPSLVTRMNMAREVVNLGRVLRAKHSIKNRQPLSSLTVAVASENEKNSLETLSDIIKDELNIKVLSISLDESSLVKYQAKANFKVLGKRLGKAMKTVAGKVATFSHDEIKGILNGTALELPEGSISAEDIILVREVKEGLVVEAGEHFTVALDTIISEELLQEGLARECVNKIQNLRKNAGFSVTDRISLSVDTEGEIFKKTLKNFENYIKSEVLADSLNFSKNCLESENIVEYNGQVVHFKADKIL